MFSSRRPPRTLSRAALPQSDNFFRRLVMSQRFLAIIGLVFLVLVFLPLAKTYSQRKLVEKEIKDVEKQISDAEKKNRELAEMIQYLQSPQYLETQARLNLNLKKPGESVIVINSAASATAVPVVADGGAGKNNYAKWWYYFFN